jgi:hypothetical protein
VLKRGELEMEIKPDSVYKGKNLFVDVDTSSDIRNK